MLKRTTPLSKGHLIVVAVIFAAIGGYVLYRSFAAGTPVATLEAEQLLLPAGGSIVNDANASGGRAVDLSSNGTATGTVNFASAVNSVTVAARGVSCQGAPQMVVKLDGNTLLTSSVSSTSWTGYTAATNYAAGTHSLSVSFTNDYSKPHGKKACSRDLFVDVANFFGAVAPPPAPPTVSLSANPLTVSPGQSSTLTWNSANANTCAASGSWSGDKTTSGSASTGALNQTSTYNLTCTNNAGSATSSATVKVSSPTIPPPPTIYFNPPTQGYSVGSTFTVEIHENSGTTGVNAIQANLSFPSNLLSVVSSTIGSDAGSKFTNTAQNTIGNGTITIAAGAACNGTCAPLTDDQLVAKITFKANAAGTANLAFTNGTVLLGASNSQNIISSLSADGVGVYTIQ